MSNEPIFLYVEDDAMSRQVMKVLLTRTLNYKHLTIFEDSKNFWDRLVALPSKPDIIFLDIHMRPYNGFEILEMLRNDENYQDSRIIALTASVMNEEVEELRQAGFDGGIAKPIDQQRFPELLEAILQGEAVWYIV